MTAILILETGALIVAVKMALLSWKMERVSVLQYVETESEYLEKAAMTEIQQME